jgi:ATP-dependent exoDNAse (exonuclease V) alpha subunit
MTFWETFKETFGVVSVDIDELSKLALRSSQEEKPSRLFSSEDIEVTDEYRQVLEWVKAKAPVIFVSGKAGTGKTTFIKYLRSVFEENLVVVAPTGVAALNIQGATIHSFFRFPPRIMTDDDIVMARDRKLYTKMSLLIIDEASMGRADIIDAINKFLRKNRENPAPFGGVQVLLVGDLFQLPPVVNRREKDALQAMRYESPYFFSAKAFKASRLVAKDLSKIYRQSDPYFVGLLNKVRSAEDVENVVAALNQRCFSEADSNGKAVITLTCTNHVADRINDDHLSRLSSPPITFKGEVSGKFALEDEKLPSPLNLTLKVGAQVMFTKNDDTKRWVNGTLGKVVELGPELIRVEAQDRFATTVHDVQKVTWEAFRYRFDDVKDQIVSERTGLYIQYPVMLAWAVTIHKGQGKTLEKVRVDLGSGAFDYGQVYVALSRCRSLDDIQLVRPIKAGDIRSDPIIKRFYMALQGHDH